MANVIDFIKTKLRSKTRGYNKDGTPIPLPENLVNDVPVYVDQAIIQLQRDNLLPPRTLEFVSIDEKQEHRKINDDTEVEYNYFDLPEDYRELEEFYTDEVAHYKWETGWQYFKQRFKKDGKHRFTIIDRNPDSDSDPKPRLIAYPFPKDDWQVTLKYYIDGSKTSIDNIDKTYWSAIADYVMAEMGLMSRTQASENVADVVSQKKNKRGLNTYNGTILKTKASYFGKW